VDSDDDIDQFIEHEDEFGQVIKRPKSSKKKRRSRTVSNAQLRQAEEIFGDSEYFGMERVDEEGEERKSKKTTKLEEAFDPDALQEHFMTPEDDEIRNTDIPGELKF
jgi:hypothetical protein